MKITRFFLDRIDISLYKYTMEVIRFTKYAFRIRVLLT